MSVDDQTRICVGCLNPKIIMPTYQSQIVMTGCLNPKITTSLHSYQSQNVIGCTVPNKRYSLMMSFDDQTRRCWFIFAHLFVTNCDWGKGPAQEVFSNKLPWVGQNLMIIFSPDGYSWPGTLGPRATQPNPSPVYQSGGLLLDWNWRHCILRTLLLLLEMMIIALYQPHSSKLRVPPTA